MQRNSSSSASESRFFLHFALHIFSAYDADFKRLGWNKNSGLKPGEKSPRQEEQVLLLRRVGAGQRLSKHVSLWFGLGCKHCVWAWTSSIFDQAPATVPGSCCGRGSHLYPGKLLQDANSPGCPGASAELCANWPSPVTPLGWHYSYLCAYIYIFPSAFKRSQYI